MKDKILNYFKDLTFTEKDHSYYWKGNKVNKSVSAIVNKFSEEFDKMGNSLRVAKNTGRTQQEVLDEWEEKARVSRELGTRVHSFAEKYMLNRDIETDCNYEKAVKKFWAETQFSPIMAECQMYHKRHKFCGTADLLLLDTVSNSYVLGDFKTNSDLFKNFKGKKMLDPFDILYDMPHSKYSLQLSLYQLLIEQVKPIKISARVLIHLLPDGTYKQYFTKDYSKILNDVCL